MKLCIITVEAFRLFPTLVREKYTYSSRFDLFDKEIYSNFLEIVKSIHIVELVETFCIKLFNEKKIKDGTNSTEHKLDLFVTKAIVVGFIRFFSVALYYNFL